MSPASQGQVAVDQVDIREANTGHKWVLELVLVPVPVTVPVLVPVLVPVPVGVVIVSSVYV